MTHTIRPARAPDTPAIAAMIHALAAHHGDPSELTPEQLMFLTQGPRPWADCLVACKAGVIVGYAAMLRRVELQHGRKIMELSHLYVTEDCRGQGIGKALIDACFDQARLERCGVVTVGVDARNPQARQVYERAGFEVYENTGWKMARAL